MNGHGENEFVGAFSAVNESTWEHLKLIFYPALLTTVVGYFVLVKGKNQYICARLEGILAGLIFVVVFFYTYTGILGKNIDIINILSFFIGVFVLEYTSYKFMLCETCDCNKPVTYAILIILFICFILFTYITPEIGLFKDPITGDYGIVRTQ